MWKPPWILLVLVTHLRHSVPKVLLAELQEALPVHLLSGDGGGPLLRDGAARVGDVELVHRPADPAVEVWSAPGRGVCREKRKVASFVLVTPRPSLSAHAVSLFAGVDF